MAFSKPPLYTSMLCEKLTVKEYQDLIRVNPNAKGYPSENDCNCCADAGECVARWCFMDVIISPWFEENYFMGKQTPGSCEEIGAVETGQYTSGGYVWKGCRFLFNNLPVEYRFLPKNVSSSPQTTQPAAFGRGLCFAF
jgi:hypothetical protein